MGLRSNGSLSRQHRARSERVGGCVQLQLSKARRHESDRIELGVHITLAYPGIVLLLDTY